MVGDCKLCGHRKPLIKAHIIPRQYYRRIMHGHPNLLQYAITEQEFAGYTQSGLHEDDLLCADCDRRIGAFDEYGYKVLPGEIDETHVQSAGRIRRAVYSFGLIDVPRFRLFLVSLAWRAGIARHQMFQLVELGPYGDRLRQILLGDTTHLNAIGAVIILFQPPEYPDILWSPFSRKVGRVNSVVFYLPPWKLELKLDKRDFQPPFNKFAIRDGQEAFAVIQDYWSQGELKVLQDAQLAIKAQARTRQ